jgi:hypothetical protein
VFILEHYFESKSFAAVRVAFTNAYPDSEVPSKTTIHTQVTKLRDTKCLYFFKKVVDICCKAVL